MKTQTKESQNELSPSSVLEILKEGNQRFVNNLKADRNLLDQVNDTKNGQYPFAIILNCIDSRVPTELIFDQGVGDVFTVRVAGNSINEDILGSMEYACKVAGSKLIVVLGHSSCGAVKGACDHVELGNITGLLQKIQPAIDAVEEKGDRSSSNASFVQKVAEKNVQLSMELIRKNSPVLLEMIEKEEIALAGGMYSVETGKVKFS